ncbi:hypothetical protein PMALA_033900 [Plasmodium malariae]|uniref:Uncharacterized protein n=1 Tax=Plasmodium malariae TaxID=5858 RepID=A0A1A8WHS1_PLAMA|nr:hypothetical protein PMALA_033900 [Plasmodium malariae]
MINKYPEYQNAITILYNNAEFDFSNLLSKLKFKTNGNFYGIKSITTKTIDKERSDNSVEYTFRGSLI